MAPARGTIVPTDADVEQLAGYAAIVAAIAGVGYAVAFVVVKSDVFSALFLLIGSALSLVPLVTVYGRFRNAQPTLARWALIMAAIGAAGAAIHGGYDLANALHPEDAVSGVANPVDPRGLLTFGASGVALLIGGYLVGLVTGLPTWSRWLVWATGAALIVTYLGRLIVLDAKSPFVLGPALVAGVLSPIVYLGLGLWLVRDAGAANTPTTSAAGTGAKERAD
jgi:hypothetical protein